MFSRSGTTTPFSTRKQPKGDKRYEYTYLAQHARPRNSPVASPVPSPEPCHPASLVLVPDACPSPAHTLPPWCGCAPESIGCSGQGEERVETKDRQKSHQLRAKYLSMKAQGHGPQNNLESTGWTPAWLHGRSTQSPGDVKSSGVQAPVFNWMAKLLYISSKKKRWLFG